MNTTCSVSQPLSGCLLANRFGWLESHCHTSARRQRKGRGGRRSAGLCRGAEPWLVRKVTVSAGCPQGVNTLKRFGGCAAWPACCRLCWIQLCCKQRIFWSKVPPAHTQPAPEAHVLIAKETAWWGKLQQTGQGKNAPSPATPKGKCQPHPCRSVFSLRQSNPGPGSHLRPGATCSWPATWAIG